MAMRKRVCMHVLFVTTELVYDIFIVFFKQKQNIFYFDLKKEDLHVLTCSLIPMVTRILELLILVEEAYLYDTENYKINM